MGNKSEVNSANGNTNVYAFKAIDSYDNNISGDWLVTLPNGDTKRFRIDCKTGEVMKDPQDIFFNKYEIVLKSFSKALQNRQGCVEEVTITEDEGGVVAKDTNGTVIYKYSLETSQDVPLNLNEVRKPVQKGNMPGVQEESVGKIGEIEFDGKICNTLTDGPLKMSHDTFGAKIRNFFADLAMKIAAFFHGEARFEKNDSTSDQVKAAIPGLGFTINNGDIEVIDTPRDGNCMLWSTLVSKYSAKKVKNSFSEVRNIIIPGLRKQIAKKNTDDRKNKIRKNVDLGAANIKPQEMAAISEFLNTDIAIITQQGCQPVAYLCTREGECKTNQSEEWDLKRFVEALSKGPAIYATNGHARALKVLGGIKISDKINF